MTRYLLLILFIATMAGRALNLDFGLAPGLSIKNAMLYAAFLAIAIDAAMARNRKVELLSVIVPYTLLLLYAMLTWLIIVLLLENPLYDPLDTFIPLKTKLGDQFLVLLVFFYGLVNWQEALSLLKALVWVVVVGCLITVIDTFDVPDLGIITTRPDGRVEGIIGSSQEFGAMVAFFLPAILVLWWLETGWKKSLALLGIILALLSILLSASRGAMLGVVAGAILAAIYLRQFISAQIVVRTTMAVLVVTGVAIVLVLSTDFGYVLETRMATGITTGDLESLSSGRTPVWTAALREMAQAPLTFLTGFGWEAYYQRIGHRLPPHSVYVDRLYNLGVIGLALFVLTYANTIRVARHRLENAPDEAAPFLMALVLGMTAFMIAMTFSSIEGAATYIWAYAGLALRIAVSSPVDSKPAPPVQFLRRPWSRDHANPTTRPTSVTPRR